MAHSLATERLGERFLLVVGEISLEAVGQLVPALTRPSSYESEGERACFR